MVEEETGHTLWDRAACLPCVVCRSIALPAAAVLVQPFRMSSMFQNLLDAVVFPPRTTFVHVVVDSRYHVPGTLVFCVVSFEADTQKYAAQFRAKW